MSTEPTHHGVNRGSREVAPASRGHAPHRTPTHSAGTRGPETRIDAVHAEPPESAVRSLLAGALLGVAILAAFASVPALIAIIGFSFIFLVLAAGFGRVSNAVLWLAAMVAAAIVLWIAAGFIARRAIGAFTARVRGPSSWIGFGAGVLGALAIAFALAPPGLKNKVIKLLDGDPLTAAPAPSSPGREEVERMRTVTRPAAEAGDARAQFALGLALRYGLDGERIDRKTEERWIGASAAQPDGHEARIMLASEKMAGFVGALGRVQNDDDVAQKVAALQALDEAREGPWRSVVWGTVALAQQITYAGSTDDDAPMRATLAKAGHTGSHAFTMLSGALDEAAARGAARRGDDESANTLWSRAITAYARTGNLYETQRARIESGSDAPLAAIDIPERQPVDPGFSARLHEFSERLDGDRVPRNRVPPGNRSLAQAAALHAMEMAPDPASIAGSRPMRTLSSQSGGMPLQRWLLALRHARGDCMAALELSNQIPVDAILLRSPIGSFNLAWALAWAEHAAQCAQSEVDRASAEERSRHARCAALIHQPPEPWYPIE